MSEVIEHDAPQAISLAPVAPPAVVVDLAPCEREVAEAEAMVVDSNGMLEIAVDTARANLTKLDALEQLRTALKRPFLEGGRMVDGWFRRPTQLRSVADAIYKKKIGTWRQKERERIAREEAEAAAKLRAEREKLEREAAKAEAKGKAEQAEAIREAAAAIPERVVMAAPAKVAGASSRPVYKAVIEDPAALLAFVAANEHFRHFVTFDQAALNDHARHTKDGFKIPGCRLDTSSSETIRR